mmetsp:Transcript_15523/g.31895  ORF Transcript_15523/g.31895 Transcript_15523/m.31895 type:complete len:100 (-) Transcript_15523:2081-2380(-)
MPVLTTTWGRVVLVNPTSSNVWHQLQQEQHLQRNQYALGPVARGRSVVQAIKKINNIENVENSFHLIPGICDLFQMKRCSRTTTVAGRLLAHNSASNTD